MFNNVITTGLDILMPIKKILINLADAPWMTQHLKSLILKRQKAFHDHGAASSQNKFYRNIVNRERKLSKANYYKSIIEHSKNDNPRLWWNEIKRLWGASCRKLRKVADVSPLPKIKPVTDLRKDLRPISLTGCLSKIAEEFIVCDYVRPAVLNILDPCQYGAIPKSSTTYALIHMVHN